MWSEKRLISLKGAAPGEGGVEHPVKAEVVQSAKDALLKSTRDALQDHEQGVADSAVRLSGSKDFPKRFADLHTKLDGLEKLGVKDRAPVILEMRRNIIEIKFLMGGASAELIDIESKLAKISAEDKERSVFLYDDLEKTRESISPENFLKLSVVDKLRLVSNIKSWDDLKDETLVVFDFGSNTDLQYQIGVGDLMPPEIRKISVGKTEYTREGNQGFYANGKYLAIWSGTKVKISAKDKDYSAKVEYEKAFGELKESSDVLEVARDFLIDARLLESILKVKGGDGEHGIKNAAEFLHIAARYLQNAKASFAGELMDGSHYSAEFLGYAINRFNLFNTYVVLDADLLKNVINKYSALIGEKLEVPVLATSMVSPNVSENWDIAGHDQLSPAAGFGSMDVNHKQPLRARSRVLNYSVDAPARAIWEKFKNDESFVRFTTDYSKRIYKLRATAYHAYEYARTLARSQGYDLKITSAFRSKAHQESIWNHSDESEHHEMVARPGASWHQTGGTMDIALVDVARGRDLCRRKGRHQKKYKAVLEEIMNRSGFVRYEKEWWHFEMGSDGWYDIMNQGSRVSSGHSKQSMVYDRV